MEAYVNALIVYGNHRYKN